MTPPQTIKQRVRAALGSAAAYVTSTLASVQTYKIVIAVLIALLAVVLPTSVLAVVKLRSRDLAAILEGAGWAINARMRLTFRQGRVFAQQPRRPVRGRGFRPCWTCVLLAGVILAEVIFLFRCLRRAI